MLAPVELGVAQFDALPPSATQLQCDEGPAGGLCPDWMIPRFDGAPPHEFGAPAGEGLPHEEHDFDDATTTPGGPDSTPFSVFTDEHMSW